jgi:GTPase
MLVTSPVTAAKVVPRSDATAGKAGATTPTEVQDTDRALGLQTLSLEPAANFETVAVDLPPESDEGNIEYKRMLVDPPPQRFAELVTQLKYRMAAGHGEAMYQLGYEDNGRARGVSEDTLEASIATVRRMAAELSADVMVWRRARGREGWVAQLLVRVKPRSCEEFTDIRVCVSGNVDAGKSSLLGVLCGTGQLDNGRGLARAQVLTHKHELETGRTSAISMQLMGFDGLGRIVNYTNATTNRQLSWSDIVSQSSKLVTFCDLAGHEKYLKTTMFGLTAHAPDYCMMVVALNQGVLRMTQEHFAIALALKIPVFVVFTKSDLAPANVADHTMSVMVRMLKSSGARKIPVSVKVMDDVSVCARNMPNDRMVPMFVVSNVTGAGLDLLRAFLNLLPARHDWSERIKSSYAEFTVDDHFSVPGVGTVVSGVCVRGILSQGQSVFLGPDSHGRFTRIAIKSIHYKRVAVQRLFAGQSGSLALKKIRRERVRKGMVVLSTNGLTALVKTEVPITAMGAGSTATPSSVMQFEADVALMHHSTSVRKGYQPIVHCSTIRQAAQVTWMDREVVRMGERACVQFRFLYRPEWLQVGDRFCFREGRTKGIGQVTRLVECWTRDLAPVN